MGYLNNLKRKPSKGFTLIELVVVMVIIGVLSAIALPSFLNQSNKARQSEAKLYIGSLNTAQAAHYLEKSTFAPTIQALEIGIQPTTNYIYTVEKVNNDAVVNIANARRGNLHSYLGGVRGGWIAGQVKQSLTLSVVCESTEYGQLDAKNLLINLEPKLQAEALQCQGAAKEVR